MVALNALFVGGIAVLFGGVILFHARSTRERYATAEAIDDAGDEPLEPGSETTVRGPVRVDEPASPVRTGPDLAVDGDPPALWAWRIRRKGGTGPAGSGTRWRTAEGGLAVGEFALEHGWDRVRVDTSTLEIDANDPFTAELLHLGDPETESYLGKLDPINRFLERTGLADDDGIVSDLEVSISVGGKTNWPDKYQATVIREGDELAVRGELLETADGYVLRGTEETPLIVGSGDLEAQSDQLRSKLRLQRAVGGGLISLGVLVVAVGVV